LFAARIEIVRVIQFPNELLRCWVQSDHEWTTCYLVDLMAWDGNGFCGCPDFQFRLQKDLNRGAKPIGDSHRCKHLRFARFALGRELVDHLIQKANAKKQSKETWKEPW